MMVGEGRGEGGESFRVWLLMGGEEEVMFLLCWLWWGGVGDSDVLVGGVVDDGCC